MWLTGVRRVGKTTLAKGLEDATFLNCDLPGTARLLEEPERFLGTVKSSYLVLDEIHQLSDPSRILKIAADEHRQLKVLATGSSTLAATTKFRDSLTGRKRTVHLLPVLYRELGAFGAVSIERRLLRGGLPEALLTEVPDEGFFAEWLDSYFARDVQELFRVGKRHEFLKLVELVLRQSGGLVEYSSLAKHSGLSRITVMTYLEVLQVTHLLTLVRPYHGGGRQEILHQPRAYGFDTGFVSYANGWSDLREQELGLLWEHLVLEGLLSTDAERRIHYWRDKRRREVDFVLPGGRGHCDAIECKWDARSFSPRSMVAFRALHPTGGNYVLSPQVEAAYSRSVAGLEVVFANLEQWETGEAHRIVSQSSPPGKQD